MKLKELKEMAVMNRSDIGFGMSQYIGERFGLVGGYRVGSSPAGLSRLQFIVMDLDTVEREGPDSENAQLGKVDLFMDSSNQIHGIVNIELNKNARGSGVGREIIKDLVDTAGGELHVYDIEDRARGFWEKMGVEYTQGKRYGVIRN